MVFSEFFTILDRIAERILKIEEERDRFNKIIEQAKEKIDLALLPDNLKQNIWGNRLTEKLKESSLRGLKVAGIDGGLISKSFHGIDIAITRAVAAIFEYRKDSPKVKYYPEDPQFPDVKTAFNPYSTTESELFANLERINAEIEVALEILKSRPDIILLDGSILPQLRERTGLDSSLTNKYNVIVKKYEQLFEEVTENNIFLAGCIKDTRSRRFLTILSQLLPILINKFPQLKKILDSDYNYRTLLERNKDSDFLYRLLKVGERSLIFDYHDFANQLPRVFSIFNQYWVEKIKIFYLKSVAFDLPIRIEVLAPESKAERIISICNRVASIIYPLSKHHFEFAVPTVLIEADAKARMGGEELDFVYNSLSDKLGKNSPLLFKLRRNRRPF
ncbi:MAG: hypothetical protein GF329_10135 [Candidatus Lokiarchaeota archaeon]|nr:hypothetical protein [Candidatus Lokiarchaeota archaeon]